MATYPGWGSMDYHQRMSAIQSGTVDAQGNATAQQSPYSTQVQGPGGDSGSGGAGSYYTTGPDGKTTTTVTPNLIPQETQSQVSLQNNQAGIDADQMRLKAQLAADAEARRLASIRSLSSTSTPSPVVSGGPSAGEEEARNAAFARAKDTAGANALASLKALEDVMGGRGLRGSSIEADGIADVIMGGSSMIGDQIRSQMINDANRSAQIADRDYAGAVTQRGQNMQQQQSLLGLMSAVGAY